MESFTNSIRVNTGAPGAGQLSSALVRPVVILSILDHHSRRSEGNRVIGTLMGTIVDGVVEVKSAFPVPHTEGEQVAVDMEFHSSMFDLVKKVAPKDVIVGWYSSGSDINEASVMIHEFFSREMNGSPVHLLVDTQLSNLSMSIRAFTSVSVSLNDKPVGAHFVPLPLEFPTFDAEKSAVDLLEHAKATPGSITRPLTDLQSLRSTLTVLERALEKLCDYANAVVEDKTSPNNQVGRLLADALAAWPKLDQVNLEKVFNNNLQDLLMVVYLTNLTRTQVALSEKLQKTL